MSCKGTSIKHSTGLVILMLFCFITSWSQTDAYEEHKNEVISFMIDKMAHPLPPPPPPKPGDTLSRIPQRVVDSMNKIKVEIGLYPIMEALDEVHKSMPEEYRSLVKPKEGLEFMSLKGLRSKKGHYLEIADTNRLKLKIDHLDFLWLFNFSKIYFNEDYTKAIFEMSMSTSGLAGWLGVFCLEKEEGVWEIVASKGLLVW
ncbi:MAG: hypothetical protein WBM53_12875 [Maribacter sp.]